MIWRIEVTQTAAKQIKKMEKVSQKRVMSFLKEKLECSPDPRQYGKALRGEKGELWRYRVGDHRLIAAIEDKTVTILIVAVGHRKNIYRRKLL